MEKKLFGTDGIRGIANKYPITPEMALKLGKAASVVFSKLKGKKASKRAKILIGKDTRISGYILETALTSGICSMGVDALLVGPLPTPAISYLTRELKADAGIVINTNGFLVAVNVDIDAAAATNVTGENASGSTTILEAFAGGT